MSDDIFNGLGVEVELDHEDKFLMVKETLSRIGVGSSKTKTLFQSAVLLHKQGRYAIMHFKEMFMLDGKVNTDFTENDLARRNTIVNLLSEWKLIKVLQKDKIEFPQVPVTHLKVLSFKEKKEWTTVSKYTIGMKK
jgi:hypothetical protein